MKDWQLLDRVLAARDARARLRDDARRATRGVLGELGLNVPGWPKVGRQWFVPFVRGLRAFFREAEALRADVELVAFQIDDAGYYAILGGAAPARIYKAIGCDIEDAAPWGRLLDFDWYEGTKKLRREDLSRAPRTCLLCGGPQGDCISEMRHPLAEARTRAASLARAARRGKMA